MGVGLDDPIDLHDAATMRGLVEAIIRHELGGMPYAPETIAEGLRMAGLVQPGLAHSGTVRAAAGSVVAGVTAAAVVDAVTTLAPHAEGLAAVLAADGRQPDGMTLPGLMEPFPVEWDVQRAAILRSRSTQA